VCTSAQPGRANHTTSQVPAQQSFINRRRSSGSTQSKGHPRAAAAATIGAALINEVRSWARSDYSRSAPGLRLPAFSLGIKPEGMGRDTRHGRCRRLKPTTCRSGARWRPSSRPLTSVPPSSTTISPGLRRRPETRRPVISSNGREAYALGTGYAAPWTRSAAGRLGSSLGPRPRSARTSCTRWGRYMRPAAQASGAEERHGRRRTDRALNLESRPRTAAKATFGWPSSARGPADAPGPGHAAGG